MRFLKLTTLLILAGVVLLAAKAVAAENSPAQVMVINQVRGEECCGTGSVENTRRQVEVMAQHQIPGYFVLRWDVLVDGQYTGELRKAVRDYEGLFKLGVLVEVVPSLAQEAEVGYKGKEEDWYEAQNAFTLGYEPAERQKLVDALMAKFFAQFGYYPELVAAWMIDTPTLNYMQAEYGVKAAQITREQWGTDGYYLYGGPVHYPYPASQNWLLVPDFERESSVMILRQTVTDPLLNYGSSANIFTSQPNDYMEAGRDFTYFKDLIDQAIAQPEGQRGFALLGLENSMEEKYQEEFARQLAYVARLRGEGRVVFAGVDELTVWRQDRARVYGGRDLVGGTANWAYWVVEASYRLRLRQKDDQVFIDDVRVYDPSLDDPYANYQAVSGGYWVVPYLIDGSFDYRQEQKKIPIWVRLFGPPQFEQAFPGSRQDVEGEVSRINLPRLKEGMVQWVREENGELQMRYENQEGKEVRVRFGDRTVVVEGVARDKLKYVDYNHELFPVQASRTREGLVLEWNVGGQGAVGLKLECGEERCRMDFGLEADLVEKAREEHYPFLFPERKPRRASEKHTVLYIHNHYAVAGRNPVRIVVIPKDELGFPAQAKGGVKIETGPEVRIVGAAEGEVEEYTQLVDLFADKPEKVKVQVRVGQEVEKGAEVFFAPNCRQNWRYCLAHPLHAWWYVRAVVHDKIRLLMFGEKQ